MKQRDVAQFGIEFPEPVIKPGVARFDMHRDNRAIIFTRKNCTDGSHSCSVSVLLSSMNASRPDGNRTTHLSSLNALMALTSVSRDRNMVRFSDTHSTGMIISATPAPRAPHLDWRKGHVRTAVLDGVKHRNRVWNTRRMRRGDQDASCPLEGFPGAYIISR